jgi:TPR repeat protein
MPLAKTEETADPSSTDAAIDADIESQIASLKVAGDADGLLALAKQFRAGTGGAPKNMAACFQCYVAAADLGHTAALHATGLFFLNGGVVTRDEREAATRFRAAADQGHLASKVIVGNFYELGIHFRADAAKADVWYRNVARTAEVDAEPESAAWKRALAELGCARYAIEIAEASEDEAEKARFLKVARTYGYAGDRSSRASMTPETRENLALDEMEAAAPRVTQEAQKEGAKKRELEAEVEKARPNAALPKLGKGVIGFVYAAIFMGVGLVLGHVLDNEANELLLRGEAVPVVGKSADLILPICAALGAIPSMLVFKGAAFLRALLVGGAFVIAAEVLWGMGRTFFSTRVMQLTDAGAVGLLLGLLVFGLFGGVKGK